MTLLRIPTRVSAATNNHQLQWYCNGWTASTEELLECFTHHDDLHLADLWPMNESERAKVTFVKHTSCDVVICLVLSVPWMFLLGLSVESLQLETSLRQAGMSSEYLGQVCTLRLLGQGQRSHKVYLGVAFEWKAKNYA